MKLLDLPQIVVLFLALVGVNTAVSYFFFLEIKEEIREFNAEIREIK